jgi:hypothetical protein
MQDYLRDRELVIRSKWKIHSIEWWKVEEDIGVVVVAESSLEGVEVVIVEVKVVRESDIWVEWWHIWLVKRDGGFEKLTVTELVKSGKCWHI